MTVFVVICGAYPSDQYVRGVYSSRELAERGVDEGNKRMRAERIYDSQLVNYCSIDEYVLDEED